MSEREAGRAPARLGTRASALARPSRPRSSPRWRASGSRSSWSRSSPPATDDRRADQHRRHRRVRLGAARRAAGRRVDLAVHSAKDLPTAPEPGLVVAAVPGREDPRDALCARDGLTLAELPVGAPSAPGPRAGPRSCGRSAWASRSCRSGATSTPGWAWWPRASWTRWCWLGRAGPAGPAGRGHRGARPAADAAGAGAGRAGGGVPRGDGELVRCSPSSTTRRPRRDLAERALLAGWRPAAPRRSAPWPRWSRATTARSCRCAAGGRGRRLRRRPAAARPGRRRRRSAGGWPDLLADGAANLAGSPR